MTTNIKVFFSLLAIGTAFSLTVPSCQKMDRPELKIIPDDTAKQNGPLQRYFAFENNTIDSIFYGKGTASSVTYAAGVNGMAYKGGANSMIVYSSAGTKIAAAHSFTVALWMKTDKHADGAQCVFMLPRTDDFWGNMFMLIEANSSTTDNTMLLKFNAGGNWWEFNNAPGMARLPNMYGAWKHLVFSYNENTSVFSMYIDGVKQTLPDAKTNLKSGSNPLGAGFKFTNPSKLVIGAYQQHTGSPWSAADSWMKKYTGMLDQFRMYTRALTDAEVTNLFTTKQ